MWARRAFCDIVADQLGQMETREFLNLTETLLAFASGENLDLIGEIRSVYRIGQQSATVPAGDNNFQFYVRAGTRFGDINSGMPIEVPAGTQITTISANGPVYTLSGAITLPADASQFAFSADSAAAGASGNAAAGVFTEHNCTNYTERAYGSLLVKNNYGIVGGRDEEDDDSFRYRIYQKIRGQSGHNEAALRFELLQVPGIQDVVMERKAGTYYVYVYGISPETASSLIDSVQQVINDHTAWPATGLAIAPDLVGISLSTTIRLAGSLTATDQQIVLGNAVAAAQDYINNLGIGQELIIK